jgi:hypothetical protein
MRSFSSVDVEVCADGVLSSERTGVQSAVQTQLRSVLHSSAVYLAREFTKEGAVCFLYVHQATSAEGARAAVSLLLGDTGEMDVEYKKVGLLCRIEAVPWIGEEVGPLGVGWELTANDVLLWGGCLGGVLTMCLVGVCCCVQLSWKRDSKRAEELLRQDRERFGTLKPRKATETRKVKKKVEKVTDEEEAEEGDADKKEKERKK